MKSRRKREVNLPRWNLAAVILISLYAVNMIIFAAAMINEDAVTALGLGEYTRQSIVVADPGPIGPRPGRLRVLLLAAGPVGPATSRR